MLDIFRALFTLFRRRRAHTDCLLFQLHYRVTVALLLFFSVVVGLRQYVWSPIVCYGEDIPRDILDAYCWSRSTFTVHGEEGVLSGVASPTGGNVRRHRYYQWVVICLFFQALLFYLPKWLWRAWEGGKIQSLRSNLSPGYTSEEEKLKRSEHVLEYLTSKLNSHDRWARKYFFCELLAWVNVLGQMFLMDRFLGGVFWRYGSEVISFLDLDSEQRTDPMVEVFPELTKCQFSKFSASGFVQKHDTICVMPLNLLNQRLYVFLWFWCVILLTLTSCCLLYRVALLRSERLRVYLLRLRHTGLRKSDVRTVVHRLSPGDWFLLYLLGSNVEEDVFRELLTQLSHKYCEDKYEANEVL